jgi:hypothetical protein
MFWTKFVEKIKKQILCSKLFFFFFLIVEKYGTARQATDDNIRWRMHIAYLIPKTISTLPVGKLMREYRRLGDHSPN